LLWGKRGGKEWPIRKKKFLMFFQIKIIIIIIIIETAGFLSGQSWKPGPARKEE